MPCYREVTVVGGVGQIWWTPLHWYHLFPFVIKMEMLLVDFAPLRHLYFLISALGAGGKLLLFSSWRDKDLFSYGMIGNDLRSSGDSEHLSCSFWVLLLEYYEAWSLSSAYHHQFLDVAIFKKCCSIGWRALGCSKIWATLISLSLVFVSCMMPETIAYGF